MQELFSALGLGNNEAKVYLSLAEIGRGTAHAVGKKTGLARTTAYSVLESLSRKGLVSVEARKNTSYFTVNGPAALVRLVESEQASLDKKKQSAVSLVKLITPFFKHKNFSLPKIQIFDGTENVVSMLYEYTDIWQRSLEIYDNCWWGFQDHNFVENSSYRKWLNWYWGRKPNQSLIKLVSNEAEIEKKLKGQISGRTIISVGKDFEFSGTLWICGDYIIMIMSRNAPNYAFQLHDPVFAANLRALFKLLWFKVSS